MDNICKIVNLAVEKAGGYWKPETILIRLGEETGEVCKAFRKGTRQDIADELADVVITAVCLANRLCLDLHESFELKLKKLEQS